MYQVHNENCLVNFANSFLKHYGVEASHDSIPAIDEVLKGHKKIAVLLFDGMGANITRMHLKEKDFIRTNYFRTINSTFPPTTAAATVGFLSGKYPIETGWLAWTLYFEKYNRNLILFNNKDYNTGEVVEPRGEKSIAERMYPYKSILELIKEKSECTKVVDVRRYPIQKDGPKTLRQLNRKINKELKDTENCFLYAYFDSPDYEMHEHGINSGIVHRYVKRINRMIKSLTQKNPDTIFFLFADHGHINVNFKDMCDHDDLFSLLSQPMTIEKRTPGIYVKKGKEKEFEALFNKYYGEDFDLISQKEALDMNLFGEGKPTDEVMKLLPDYIGLAKNNTALYTSKDTPDFMFMKGHHGGASDEERLIDISVYNK